MIIISIALIGISTAVVAKGPERKVTYAPDIRSLSGNLILFRKNPSSWLNAWKM